MKQNDFYTPGDDLGYRIHYLDTQMKIGLQRAFKKEGFNFTAVQYGILSLLWAKEGLHQADLASKAGKDRHNMTRVLNVLEKEKCVLRKADPDDKRRFNIFLTSKGKALKDKLNPIVSKFLEQALSGLSKQDVQELFKLHGKILKNLEALQ